MPNIYKPAFEEGERPPAFRARRARIGYDVGSELIGCSLWEVPPGEAAYPYHYHYGDEELVIVIRGRPTLRTPEGNRELDEGEAVRFPLGEDGAHQILNRTQDTVTFLAISSHGRPDIVVYPDSNKLGVGSVCHAAAACARYFTASSPSSIGTESSRPASSAPTCSGAAPPSPHRRRGDRARSAHVRARASARGRASVRRPLARRAPAADRTASISTD